MSRTRSASPLKELLPNVLKGLKDSNRPTREAIDEVWRRAAGREAASHSWVVRWTQGRMMVAVENSGWMYLLGLKKGELLKKLLAILGRDKVKELIFRIGEAEDAKG